MLESKSLQQKISLSLCAKFSSQCRVTRIASLLLFVICYNRKQTFVISNVAKNITKNKCKQSYFSITILLQRSSIFPARAWYLLACFLNRDGIFDKSVLPILSKLTNSCSSSFNLEDTPVDSPSTFQGDSLLNKCFTMLRLIDRYQSHMISERNWFFTWQQTA